MPEAYWAVIATLVVMQSTLGATLTLSLERIVATAVGVSRSARGNFFGRKPRRVRGCDRFHRIALDRVSSGEDCISVRQRYPRHHRSDSAFGSGVDYRVTQVS